MDNKYILYRNGEWIEYSVERDIKMEELEMNKRWLEKLKNNKKK